MTEPLISFLLIDTDKNSLSKFESSQAEITAFFQKLLVPISVHSVRGPQDASKVIRASGAKVFAIVDSPVCFPLTHVLTYLQTFLNNPKPEDLFFLVWDKKSIPETASLTPSFLEDLAISTLSPPHTAFPMECFPPLVVMTSKFARTQCSQSAEGFFETHPLWLRLALNLYAYGHPEVTARHEVLEGKQRPWRLSNFGLVKNLLAWWAFQKLLAKSRRRQSGTSKSTPPSSP